MALSGNWCIERPLDLQQNRSLDQYLVPEQGQGLDPARVLALLRRQFRLIIGCVVLSTAFTGLWLLQVVPIYTASTQLLLVPRKEKVLAPDAVIADLSGDVNSVSTELALVRSFSVASRVVERLKLEDGVRLHEQTKVLLETYARESGEQHCGKSDQKPVHRMISSRGPHWLACLRFSPVSFAIAASLSFSSLMAAANSAGPWTSKFCPVATSGFSIAGFSAITARTSAAICSRTASDMPRGPNRPPGLPISSAG